MDKVSAGPLELGIPYPVTPYPKLIINAAITGMIPTKEDTPHVPITPAEIIADAVACADAGASIVHVHARDAAGRRPVHADHEPFQTDPHWRDLLLFHEFFHAETGAGLGASHQTGWTGLVAKTIQLFGQLNPSQFLDMGKQVGFSPQAAVAARR